MSTVGIKDLKIHLGQYVSRAARGETITVTDRGTPVAIHLAAALELRTAENKAIEIAFCSFDDRQNAAARAENLKVFESESE